MAFVKEAKSVCVTDKRVIGWDLDDRIKEYDEVVCISELLDKNILATVERRKDLLRNVSEFGLCLFCVSSIGCAQFMNFFEYFSKDYPCVTIKAIY